MGPDPRHSSARGPTAMGAACGCSAAQDAEQPVSQPHLATTDDKASQAQSKQEPAKSSEAVRQPLAPKNKNVVAPAGTVKNDSATGPSTSVQESQQEATSSASRPSRFKQVPEEDVNKHKESRDTSQSNKPADEAPVQPAADSKATDAAPATLIKETEMVPIITKEASPVAKEAPPPSPETAFSTKKAAQAELEAAYTEFRLNPSPECRDKVFALRQKVEEAKRQVASPVQPASLSSPTISAKLPPIAIGRVQSSAGDVSN